MSGPFRPDATFSRRDAVEDEPSREPRYVVTAVAVRVGLGVQTLRRYEAVGLIEPETDETGHALYSEADIDRIRRARRLVSDLGVNLAGAVAILHLRQQILTLQRELRVMRERDARR